MNPLITVIIPARNAEKTLASAADSISAQTYRNLQIIIVDDWSADRTRAIADRAAALDSRIEVIRADFDDPKRLDPATGRDINAGYGARNSALRLARGDLVTFQDADDASLLNRIEVQYALLRKYDAAHLTTGWQPFDEDLLGTTLDRDRYLAKHDLKLHTPEELYALSQQAKGAVAKLSPRLNAAIPFRYKQKRALNRLFFGSLDPYPGAGNSPLFRREVLEKVRFRKRSDRVWPSFMGRGADRDFNFQIAETFRNSWAIPLPLYLWRTDAK